METETKPHLATEICGIECTECGSVTVLAFMSDIPNEQIWTACDACGRETRMDVVDVDRAVSRDVFSLRLRQCVAEEVEGDSGLTREVVAGELRELAEDIETGSF